MDGTLMSALHGNLSLLSQELRQTEELLRDNILLSQDQNSLRKGNNGPAGYVEGATFTRLKTLTQPLATTSHGSCKHILGGSQPR